MTLREWLQQLINYDIPRDEIDGQPTKNLLIHLCQELMSLVTEMENHGLCASIQICAILKLRALLLKERLGVLKGGSYRNEYTY